MGHCLLHHWKFEGEKGEMKASSLSEVYTHSTPYGVATMYEHHMIMAFILHDANEIYICAIQCDHALRTGLHSSCEKYMVCCSSSMHVSIVCSSALLMRSFSLPPEIDDSKLPFNVEPTNESLQLLIIHALKGILKKV